MPGKLFSSTSWMLLGLALELALGCASPGPLRPPSLRLPEKAVKLSASRSGVEVLLSWTAPLDTTDGDRIRGAVIAVICREASAGRGCMPVGRMASVAGPAQWVDRLPADLLGGPARLLGYRVELLNDRSRSDGVTDAAFAVGGAAPPALGVMTLSARREAVLIRWKPESSAAAVQVRRTLIATAAGLVDAASPSAAGMKKPGLLTVGGGKEPAGEVTLGVGPGSAGPDEGGMLDGGVRDGDTYDYVGQRVQAVTLGGHALELRGEASPVVRLTYRDVFPPAAPIGLVLVPGGGFGAPASIDLSWEADGERDVLGYNVYRREGQGEFVRVNAEPVRAAFYRDLKVETGRVYGYRVTAVDERKNESAPGAEVRESLRE